MKKQREIKPFKSNQSFYLPVPKEIAKKINFGTSYKYCYFVPELRDDGCIIYTPTNQPIFAQETKKAAEEFDPNDNIDAEESELSAEEEYMEEDSEKEGGNSGDNDILNIGNVDFEEEARKIGVLPKEAQKRVEKVEAVEEEKEPKDVLEEQALEALGVKRDSKGAIVDK